MFFIRLKRYLSFLILPTLLMLFLSYLSYHTFSSNSGLSKNQHLKTKLTNINNELLLVRSEKLRIEKHISLLKKDIDADMLDEKARKILYYAHPDEVIINISKNQ